jgi:cytochrome c oxidase cbb3-type subunit 1
VHTTGVIFGFGGNALIATSFHVCSAPRGRGWRTSFSPWFVLIGYNLFCVWAVTGYLMGVTQSKEYAEPEWYADIWLVDRLGRLLGALSPHAARSGPSRISTSPTGITWRSSWSWRCCTSSTTSPCRSASAGAKSYTALFGRAGCDGAVVVRPQRGGLLPDRGLPGDAVLLTCPSGRSGRSSPIGCRSSASGASPSSTSGSGSHHLHYTALPHWVQTLGMTFSVMLLVPSWASAGNALATLNGAWHKVRDDATLRFMFVAAVFYGLSTFEGSFLAIRPVNSLSHYTDWTVGHVHSGALGWVAMITFGAIYGGEYLADGA